MLSILPPHTYRRASRLLQPRLPHFLRAVGTCPACGVIFTARVHQMETVARICEAHASVCPGGDRQDEYVSPFEPALESPDA